MGLYISPSSFVADPSRPGVSTLSSVAQSATSVSLLSANPDRRFVSIHNTANQDLFVAFAGTASLTSYTVKVPKDSFFETQSDGYTGDISGIWSGAGSGAAKITEVTT